MIVCTPDHIEISLPVAAALLAFASKDDTREHLCCVGVDQDALCATDGHRAVQFGFATDGSSHHGKTWSRDYVETAVKIAKARKLATLELRFADCQTTTEGVFPPISRVMPDDGLRPAKEPVGVNPAYLADLEKVRKACDATGVLLSSMRGSCDPLGFTVDGTHRGGVRARVAIMPMRI